MKALLLLFALLPVFAQDAIPPQPKPAMKLWYSSLGAIVAGHGIDVATSIALNGTPNIRESNSLVATSAGRFAVGRGIAIKGAAMAAVILPEYLLIRKYPKLAKPFSYMNFGFATLPIAAGVHNVGLMK